MSGFENGFGAMIETLIRIQRSLENVGAIFIAADQAGGPRGRLRENPPDQPRLELLWPHRCTRLTEGRLSNLSQELPSFSYEASEVGSSCARLSRKAAMLQRIGVARRCARTFGAAMHSTTLFAVNCRGSARRTRTGPCPAAGAAKHRTRIAPVCP